MLIARHLRAASSLAASRAEQQRIEAAGVQAAAFSPRATFLTTFQRPSKGADGSQDRNLKVHGPAGGCWVGRLRLLLLACGRGGGGGS